MLYFFVIIIASKVCTNNNRIEKIEIGLRLVQLWLLFQFEQVWRYVVKKQSFILQKYGNYYFNLIWRHESFLPNYRKNWKKYATYIYLI